MKSLKGLLLCIVMLLVFMGLTAQAQEWLWAKKAGGSLIDEGKSIVYDGIGNCYVTGLFRGTANFGNITLTSSGDADIFVAKIDNSGTWLWAIKAGGIGIDNGNGIALDSSGNIIITGYFNGTSYFGNIMLASSGDSDLFVAMLNSNGVWQWVNKAGGTSSDWGNALAVDANSNIYITGGFQATAYFGTISLTSPGHIFVAKLDNSGNWIWAKKAGGASDSSYDIAVDINGNTFITGGFYDDATFGSIILNISMYQYLYVAKLDASGNFLWVRYTGNDYDDANCGQSLEVDNFGNAYVTGLFENFVSLGGIILISSYDETDIFIAKISSSGTWLWAKQAGGYSSDRGVSLCLDDNNNVYTSGCFNGTATFGNTSVTSSNGFDTYVSKMDSSGNWLWVKTAGPEYGNAIDVNNSGDAYVTGGVSGTAIFDSTTLTAQDSYDIYVARLREPGLVVLSSYSLNFATEYIDSVSKYQPIVIKNNIATDIAITSIHFFNESTHYEYYHPSNAEILAPGVVDTIFVRFAPRNVGVFSDSLYIEHNVASQPKITIRLRGTGLYVPPMPPENIAMEMDGNNALITWDPVTENIHNNPLVPDYYLVFFNGSGDPDGEYYFHGATNGLQYTHYLVGLHSPSMFYHILAYKYYGRGEFNITDLGLKQGMTENEVKSVFRILHE